MKICHHLSRISEDRISSFGDIGECEAYGYKVCKHCAPLKKYFKREEMDIKAYCDANGIWFHDRVAYFYIDTVRSQWKIIYNEELNKLQLYHQNQWNKKDSSVIPGYYLQDQKSKTICGFLKFIVWHDKFRRKNPVYIPPPKTKLKKGSKAWKKRAKKEKKRNNNKAAKRVIKMIEHMESIDIGSGIKEIKAWMFEYCENLNIVTLPYGIEKIGYLAFYQTALLENEENYDSQGLLYIVKYLIKAKNNETGIYDVPDGIVLIAMDCFEDCYDVQNIILPGSLKYINDCALSVRNKNQKITFHGTEEQWYDIFTDSCIGTYPEDGIRILSDFPTTLLICVISVTVISTALLVLIYRKQKGVVPICSEESDEDK